MYVVGQSADNSAIPVASYLLVTLLGLGAGVLVNWLADLVDGDESPPWRAANCKQCGKPIPASRLIPFYGFSRQQRACAACGAPASVRRPSLPLALALLFPLLLAHLLDPTTSTRIAPLGVWVIDAIGFTILAFIFAVDLEHHIILDIAVYPLIAALIGAALVFNHKAFAGMGIGLVIFGGLFLILYGAGYLIYHEEALGFGDVKLAALVGMLVGWQGTATALIIIALLGAAFSALALGTGAKTARQYIPYGVFLASGTALTLLLAPPLW